MVNTFLPYPSFEQCAKCLDYKRLGKQRVEALQILNVCEKVKRGEKKVAWSNHPVVKMWLGYEECLKYYLAVMIREWVERGYKNTMEIPSYDEVFEIPWFIGWDKLHLSHRASLVRKDPKFYSTIFPDTPEEYSKYSYIWPHSFTTADKDKSISELAEPPVSKLMSKTKDYIMKLLDTNNIKYDSKMKKLQLIQLYEKDVIFLS